MTLEKFDEIFARTLDDGRLSRSERSALRALLTDEGPDANAIAAYRHRAFEAVRTRLLDHRDRLLLDWLSDMVALLTSATVGEVSPSAASAAELAGAGTEAYFSPGDACRERIVGLLRGARESVEICVFTITDNTIADAVIGAHRRGVSVRIISDNTKATDTGSDVDRFDEAGVPVAVDRSSRHMHHKFAIFDAKVVLTGSYNWTRSAAAHNQENLIVSTERRLVSSFAAEFDKLWDRFS